MIYRKEEACMSVQLIQTNQRKRRRFTPQQKLQILKEWELTGNGVAVAQKHQIHPHTLYRWRRALEQGAEEDLFEWQTASDRSESKATGGGKPKTQRGTDDSDPRVDVIKKKDELGLTNRCMGTTYSNIQRMRIISEVESSRPRVLPNSVL